MRVGVDEAGRERGVAEVDYLGSGWRGGAGADAEDARAVHHHQAGRAHFMAVEHARGFEDSGFLLREGGATD